MKFSQDELKKLWRPRPDSDGEDNGQVTIVGGSGLFQGAPLLSAIAASRVVDMVFVATPEDDKEIVNKVEIFSRIRSLIWIDREDMDDYIAKSDAILIGPGMMRYRKVLEDGGGEETQIITRQLLKKYPNKQWVIDGGSLQIMEPEWIPKHAILTTNKREYAYMFGTEPVEKMARKYECVICYKAMVAVVSDGKTTYEVTGGNPGLTKGGTGDTLAGLIVGLVAKNSPVLAAAAGSYILKKTAERLERKVGVNFNADDLAGGIFGALKSLLDLGETQSDENGQNSDN